MTKAKETLETKIGRPKVFDGDTLPNTATTKEMTEGIGDFIKHEQDEAVKDALRNAPSTTSDAVRILIAKGLLAHKKEMTK